MDKIETWCAQCGPDVRVDPDGCCATCGSDAVGYGANEAHRLAARVAELEARLRMAYDEADRLRARVAEAEARYHSDVDGAIAARRVAERRVAELEARLSVYEACEYCRDCCDQRAALRGDGAER